jgi:hypothetical protein
MFIARLSHFQGKLLELPEHAADYALDEVPILILAIEKERKHLGEARFGPAP